MYEAITVMRRHYWSDKPIRVQRWHPMRVAMLYRLGPKIGAMRLAKIFGIHPVTVSRKAAALGITLHKPSRHYEDWELAYIKRNGKKMTYAQIAEYLGRSESGVRSAALYHGINSGPHGGDRHPASKVTDHEVELARQLYEGGMSRQEIAEKMEVTASTVGRWVTFKIRLN